VLVLRPSKGRRCAPLFACCRYFLYPNHSFISGTAGVEIFVYNFIIARTREQSGGVEFKLPITWSDALFCSDPPVMNSSTVKLAIDINQSVQLICRAQSFPPPTFSWTGGTISPQRFSTFVDSQGLFPYVSVLNVSSVQPSDFGIYTCTALNEMGSSQTLFNLTVKSRSCVRLIKTLSCDWCPA
jgi:Immunoglobulin domain